MATLTTAPLAPGMACNSCHTTSGVRMFTVGAFHPHCAPRNALPLTKEEYEQVTAAQEPLREMFKKLPGKLFEGNDLRSRLAHVCTVQGVKDLVVALAELLYRKRSWLEQTVSATFDEVSTLIGKVAERLKVSHLVAQFGF